MQPSKRWVWTPATELSAYPLWAGTTSASGTPPTTGTTGVSSACSRRAAPGGRSSPRRSGWPSCWSLRRPGSRPPHRSPRREGRPTSPAPALADRHHLRFWSTIWSFAKYGSSECHLSQHDIVELNQSDPGALVPRGGIPAARLRDGSRGDQGWTHFERPHTCPSTNHRWRCLQVKMVKYKMMVKCGIR